jgi:hypothetical protein
MNQILLSFLCGAAFLGGAVSVLILIAMWTQFRDKAGREELYGYWKESIAKHTVQLELLTRIAAALEAKRDK